MAEKKLAKRRKQAGIEKPKKQQCLACDFRKASNKSLRDQQKEGHVAKGYDGQMIAISNGHIVVAQFHQDQQVGLVAIPVTDVQDTTARMNEVALGFITQSILQQRAAAAAAAAAENEEAEEDDDDDYEDDEEEDDDE